MHAASAPLFLQAIRLFDFNTYRAVTAATNLEIDNVVRAVVRATAELHYVQVIRPLIQMWRDKGAIRPEADDDVILSLLLMPLPHLALAPYYDGRDAVFGLRGRTPEEQRPIIRQILNGLSPVFEPQPPPILR